MFGSSLQLPFFMWQWKGQSQKTKDKWWCWLNHCSRQCRHAESHRVFRVCSLPPWIEKRWKQIIHVESTFLDKKKKKVKIQSSEWTDFLLAIKEAFRFLFEYVKLYWKKAWPLSNTLFLPDLRRRGMSDYSEPLQWKLKHASSNESVPKLTSLTSFCEHSCRMETS